MTLPDWVTRSIQRGRHDASFPWPASFIILGAIWGCSFWWIKLGLRAVSPVDVAFGRLAAGAIALLVVAALTRTRLPRRVATWGHLFVLAVFLNSAPFTLFAYGETHISAVLAGIINALTPLATLLAALAIFRQRRPSPKIIAGLAVGFAGVLVVVGVWHGLGRGQLLGIGACLGAVACYGVAYPYSHRHLTGLADPPVALATGQVLCGAVQLLPFAVIAGHIHQHISGSSLLALAALGVLGSGIAYILNFHVVNHAPATIASSVTYLTPFFAVIVGAAFLGEAVTWYEPVGGVLILAGAQPSPKTASTAGASSHPHCRVSPRSRRARIRKWERVSPRFRLGPKVADGQTGAPSVCSGKRDRRLRCPAFGPSRTDRSARRVSTFLRQFDH